VTCFDCGKRKNKGIPVYELSVIGRESPLPSTTIRKVCVKCWLRNYKDPWMPHTAAKHKV